jgi:hypothetical protein
MPAFNYWSSKGIYSHRKQYTRRASENFKTFNLPKVLFLFMPFFAFNLWVFHNKNDGITLTMAFYTSLFFVPIIAFLLLFLTNKVLSLFQESSILSFSQEPFYGIRLMVYYFYPAHHAFIMQTRLVSFLKSSFLLINFTLLHTSYAFIILST